jgi:hypothetical protein
MIQNQPDTDQPTPINIRASFTESTIIVYYRCNAETAHEAIQAQTLDVPTFKPSLHTWIYPSFRSGSRRLAPQSRLLALHITREGWEQALKWHQSRTSGVTPYVRVRWDRELGLDLKPLPHATLVVDLSAAAGERGLFGWIVKIEDVTEVWRKIEGLVEAGKLEEATELLTVEIPYEFLDKSTPFASSGLSVP